MLGMLLNPEHFDRNVCFILTLILKWSVDAELSYASCDGSNVKVFRQLFHGASVYCIQLVWTARRLAESIGHTFGYPERAVSYLPLSHVAAQIADAFGSIAVGAPIYFAQPDALRVCLLRLSAANNATSFRLLKQNFVMRQATPYSCDVTTRRDKLNNKKIGYR
jgi:hypothetical protein